MLSFHRSQTFEIKIQKPESPRAFVFDVAIGVTKPAPEVDPLSGMLLNLVDVDAVMSTLHNFWSSQSWTSLQSLAEKSRDFVAAELARKKTELSEIILHEKRGFWLGWRGGEWLMGREEMRELGGHLYRLQFESSFVEAQIENQALASLVLPATEDVFKSNPKLRSLTVENLGSRETWNYRRA